MFRSTKGASKQRRDLINAEIGILRDLLPLPEATRQRLSQLQIMSLACVYIRKCNFFSRLFGNGKSIGGIDYEFSQAMTGFLLVASRDGKLLYISENVTEYLGHSMVDMMTQGDSLYDIIDKRDHQLVQRQLMQENFSAQAAEGSAPLEKSSRNERSFFCRMNVARSFRRQAGFGDHKMMYVKGHFVTPSVRDHYGNQPLFIAVCTPLITPDVKETTIQNSTETFYSVHGLDMKYSELGHIGEHQLGYSEQEIINKSWYELLHPEDILEAKEKHVQLIKSSHEMGCVLTARLQHKAGHWVWMNIVMHIRQPFVCDNNEPAIVCINQVIDESEASQFKIQSQMYCSQIARSPEFLGSQDAAGGVPHTITQIPMETGGYPERGCPGSGDELTYRVNFVAAGSQLVGARRSERSPDPSSGSTVADLLRRSSRLTADRSPERGGCGSAERDAKHAIRADVISRLKRKMSESMSGCRPKKTPRYGDSQVQPPKRSEPTGVQMPTYADGGVSILNGVGGARLTTGSVQVLTSARDGPVYQQLALKKLVLNGGDRLVNVEQTVPLIPPAAKPPTPLTPESLTSELTPELTSDFRTEAPRVDAVVPPSVLTPDASPVSVPADEALYSPPPHVDPSLEYGVQLPTLDDLCFFEESNPGAKTKTKLPAASLELADASTTGSRQLPVIDAVSLESMLRSLNQQDSTCSGTPDDVVATSAAPSSSSSSMEASQKESDQPKPLSENDEQLLNQVTNVLIELVQQAADGNLDLSQLMMTNQPPPQQQQPNCGMQHSTTATPPTIKSSDGLTELDSLTQMSSAAITEEMNFMLDDLSQITQLDIVTPSFGDCDLTSSLLAQNL